ncbi:HNH endonuclease signature motif containing protein [Agromyces mariniharenae]|uniref:DUF222 domain-containing protein n=1 Tax=Agromyces mariniharenae TaxID=2604423 RepID=A0A5S4V7D5_9MICO|nr:HNH endonuclease signature motif containing protein [Agromyces mariniharenae]TYL53783.1 DUF222 domain-containing protein [Agromyces mariniharenae]
MTQPLPALEPLEQHIEEVHAAWVGAMPAFGASIESTQVDLEQMSDAGLVRVQELLARVRRDTDALLARAAAEVARRSGPAFGESGLAKSQGFHSATRLIAASTGGSRHDAARLIAVGEATAERASFTGERLPSRHPHVARSVVAAEISLEAAAAITSMLDRVALRADPDLADRVEAALAQLARQVPLDVLTRGVREAEARLDADGVEPREEELRQERSLTFREDARGVVHLNARLDPEGAAHIKAAIEALVSDALRRREQGGDDARPIVDDSRTISQIQADALAQLARHALGCAQTLPALAKTTVVVRIDLESMRDGIGIAHIDGIDQPISAGTARRMAADAELIPAVLGGASVPLDLGRAARLFSRSQRLALGERDGGCASCGQNIAYVEAHHIDWWERDAGPTDLSNGVLLCSSCHHRIHRDGWGIHATATSVWFIPPPHVDPERRPRLGGRARFDVGAALIA